MVNMVIGNNFLDTVWVIMIVFGYGGRNVADACSVTKIYESRIEWPAGQLSPSHWRKNSAWGGNIKYKEELGQTEACESSLI